jgi:hypothetical protein
MDEVNEQIVDIPGVKDYGLQLQESIFTAICSHDRKLARKQSLALVNRWRGILRAFVALGKEPAAQPQ